MLGKLRREVTRLNKEELIHQYRVRLYIFLIATIFLLFLLPFTSFLNSWMRLYPNIISTIPNSLTIHTVDVGQGLCVMVNFPNGDNMILDTGVSDAWDEVHKYTNKVLLESSNDIDYLLLSHIDSDHVGNASNILDTYSVKQVFVPNMEYMPKDTLDQYTEYNDFYSKARAKNIPIDYNLAGKVLNIGEVKITWLAPNRDYYSSTNDYSAVILFEYKDFSMLFTGDAGHNETLDGRVNVEREVINYAEENGIDLDVDVLYLGHHGSKYSTSMEWLEATMPEVALISVSQDNSYGHPANEVYDNLLEYDNTFSKDIISSTYTTANDRNIVVTVNSSSKYSIHTIDQIHSYLFISFVRVDLVILVPVLYFLLDSILIYTQLTRPNIVKDKDEE